MQVTRLGTSQAIPQSLKEGKGTVSADAIFKIMNAAGLHEACTANLGGLGMPEKTAKLGRLRPLRATIFS